MKTHGIAGGVAAMASMLLIIGASPDAHASKENFDRSKPHVNIGTIGNQNAQDEEQGDSQKIRTEVQQKKQSQGVNEHAVENANEQAKFRRSAGDEAGTLKGTAMSRAKEKANKTKSSKFDAVATEVKPATPGGPGGKEKDDDVADKTNKSETARAKRRL